MKFKRPPPSLLQNPDGKAPNEPTRKCSAFMRTLRDAPEECLAELLSGPLTEARLGPNVIQEEAQKAGFYLWTLGRTELHYWADVLDRFDTILQQMLSKYEMELEGKSSWNVQGKPFTAHDESLLHSVLEFSRLLVENNLLVTQYASIDRLFPILLTSNVCILETSLRLLYSVVKRAKRNTLKGLYADLHFRILHVLAGLHDAFPEASSADASRPGMLVGETEQQVAFIDVDERLLRYHSLLRSNSSYPTCQMLALAIYFELCDEAGESVNDIFKTHPTIISDVARNVGSEGAFFEAASLQAIRSCLRFSGKLGEIEYALALDSAQSPLLATLKSISAGAAYHACFLMPYFDFLAACTADFDFQESFVSAGFVDAILDIICRPLIIDNEPCMLRLSYKLCEKLTSLLDSLTHHCVSAQDSFFVAEGLHLIVRQTCSITAFLIEHPSSLCKTALSDFATQLLRLLEHLLGEVAEYERMRMLIDGPLFKTIKLIFDAYTGDDSCSVTVGMFVKAMAVLANYIHNEPTSLSILQEQGITASFMTALARPNALAADADMLKNIPHVFSALCLNLTGYDEFTRINPFASFITVFCRHQFRRVLSTSGLAMNLGSSMDEFVRHHPQLKPLVFGYVAHALGSCFDAAGPDGLHGCQLYSLPVDLPINDLAGTLSFIPSRLVLFEAFCLFLEGLLRSAGHAGDFMATRGGLDAFLQVLEGHQIFSYNFYTTRIASTVHAVLRTFNEVDGKAVAQGLVCQLKHALSKFVSSSRLDDKACDILPFHNIDTMKADFAVFNDVFQHICNVLGLLGLIYDLYFAPTAFSAASSQLDIVSEFWDGDRGSMLPGMASLADSLSFELSRITLDAKCQALLAAKISAFDGHNLEHLAALNMHMIVFLLKHLPSQITAVWSALMKRICSPRDEGVKVNEDNATCIVSSILWCGIVFPLKLLMARNDPALIKQAGIINAVTVLNTLLFDESGYKLQAQAYAYHYFAVFGDGLMTLEQALTLLWKEDTSMRIPLFDALLLLFARLTTPSVYKGSFWYRGFILIFLPRYDLNSNGWGKAMELLFNFAALWTLKFAEVLADWKAGLHPNTIQLFCKVVSGLTINRRSPSQASALSPPLGEKEYLRWLSDFLQSNAQDSLYFTDFPSRFKALLIPLCLSFMRQSQRMPFEMQRAILQEIGYNLLCRYERVQWDGRAVVACLLPEVFTPSVEPDSVPIEIRMHILVLLLHSTNKVTLLAEVEEAVPRLLDMLASHPNLTASVALILTEYMSLYSAPPYHTKTSLGLDDPAYDGGIKLDISHGAYAWKLPRQDILTPQAVLEAALQASTNNLSPDDVNALLRLMVACLKCPDVIVDQPRMLDLLLRMSTKSAIHEGKIQADKAHNSINALVNIAVRLMLEADNSTLVDLIQLDLVSRFAASKAAMKEGVEMLQYVFDSKPAILRNWRAWMQAAQASFDVKLPSLQAAQAQWESQGDEDGILKGGLARLHLKSKVKAEDITARLLGGECRLVGLLLRRLETVGHSINDYYTQTPVVFSNQLLLNSTIGVLCELVNSYPFVHRLLVADGALEATLAGLLVSSSFIVADFFGDHPLPTGDRTVDRLVDADACRIQWLHLLLHSICLGSTLDRSRDAKRKISAEQAAWCRIAVDSLLAAWQCLYSDHDPVSRLAKVSGVSTATSVLLDLHNAYIGMDEHPTFSNASHRQSSITAIIAAQMLERKLIPILTDNLQAISTYKASKTLSRHAIDEAVMRLSEALELLAQSGVRLGQIGKIDVTALSSGLTGTSSTDFSFNSSATTSNEEDSSDNDSEDESDDQTDSESNSMSISDDRDNMSVDDGYGYESELDDQDYSSSDEEDGGPISIIDASDEDSGRHVTFDVVTTEDEGSDDRERSDDANEPQQFLPPGVLEDAVMQVLQRSGADPNMPVDIVIEEGYDDIDEDEEDEDAEEGDEFEDFEEEEEEELVDEANGEVWNSATEQEDDDEEPPRQHRHNRNRRFIRTAFPIVQSFRPNMRFFPRRDVRTVYASAGAAEVLERGTCQPWADPSHSALEPVARPIQSARVLGLTNLGFPEAVERGQHAVPEIAQHPLQLSNLPIPYANMLVDPTKPVRQTGISIFKRNAESSPDTVRYRLADVTAETDKIAWPEYQPQESDLALLTSQIVPTHRRWIQASQVLYSYTPHSSGRSAFLFDNIALPFVRFCDALVVPLVPMLREHFGAKELEESVGFTGWDTWNPQRLATKASVNAAAVTAEDSDNSNSPIKDESTEAGDEEESNDDQSSDSNEEYARANRIRVLDNIVSTLQQQQEGQPDPQFFFDDNGFDPSFLEAMPFDMLSDAIQSYLVERRRQIEALRELRNTNARPTIRISQAFLEQLPPEVRDMYTRMSDEEDRGARFMMLPFGSEDESIDIVPLSRRTTAAQRNGGDRSTAAEGSSASAKEKEDGLPLADASSLAAILRVHYDRQLSRPKALLRTLAFFCRNRRTRDNLLGLLLRILQRCPDGDDALEYILCKFVKRHANSPVPSGVTSKSAPSTPKGKDASPSSLMVVSPLPQVQQAVGLHSDRQVIIMQRTLHLLMHLVSKDLDIKDYFAREDHSDTWTIKPTPSVRKEQHAMTTRHPLAVLLAIVDNPVFVGIVRGAGASGGLVMELLFHLIAVVVDIPPLSRNDADSSGEGRIPPAFLQAFVRSLAMPADLTPRARTHATHALQRLSRTPALAEPLLVELNHLTVPMVDHVINSITSLDEITSPTGSTACLLRLLKVLSAVVFAKASSPSSNDDAEQVQAHLQSLACWPAFCDNLSSAKWEEFRNALSKLLSEEDGEGAARSLFSTSPLLPVIECYFIRIRLLLAVLRLLKRPVEAIDAELIVFAEEHRRSLNALIQTNRSLLTSGSLHPLAAHPKVLDFENKRAMFRQMLHRRPASATTPAIALNVRRAYVFEDSFHQLMARSGEDVKYGKLTVRFHGEEGVDIGGVTREWFSVLTRAMFNADYVLFRTAAADRITYQPNRLSAVNPDHLQYFRFVGRVIGKAIYDGRLLDAYFTRSFYKHILGQAPDFRDLEAVDPEYHKSLQWTLEHDITGVLDWTFSVETEEFGQRRVIELVPGGVDTAVTEANKRDYVRAMTEYRLTTAIRPQIDAFLAGFREVVPDQLIRLFTDAELELLISGLPELDVDDWRAHTEYHAGYTSSSPAIQWFWRAVRNMEPEDRAKLLQFVTGTSKVPIEGFAGLQGSSGVQRFSIHRTVATASPSTSNTGPAGRTAATTAARRLPTAHTCFNQLDLPDYASYEELRDALMMAISECTTGFGFV